MQNEAGLFLALTPKAWATTTENKLDDTGVRDWASKDTRELKGNPWRGRKYFQTVYLLRL